MLRRLDLIGLILLAVLTLEGAAAGKQESRAGTGDDQYDFRLLATNRTSTMEREMAEAADAGYRFKAVMGGETAVGGSEVVVVMQKDWSGESAGRYQYKLMATSRTSTMQKELQEAGDNGYEYCGQTVFKTALGGNEVVVILERDRDNETVPYYEYRLLATKKTSTMQKELNEAGMEGFMLVGLTVSKTSFGGSEVVSILKRRGKQ